MKSPSSTPERLLTTGLFGAGKSECWVQWAAHCRRTDDPRKFRVINTDTPGTVQQINERWDDWESNIEYMDVSSWETLTPATSLYVQLTGPDDVLVIDAADKPWGWVRDAYDYLQAKKNNELPDPNDMFGFIPENDTKGKWDPINSAYQRWIMPIIDPNQCPGHVLMTSPSQPIKVRTEKSNWEDDKAIQREFGRFTVRPAGNKHLTYQMRTILLAEHTTKGYTLTTMKDRSRPELSEAVLAGEGGFVLSYLAGCAGWSI